VAIGPTTLLGPEGTRHADDEASLGLLDRPGRREAALRHALILAPSGVAGPLYDAPRRATNGRWCVFLEHGKYLGIFNSRTQTVNGKDMSTAKRTPMRTREMKPNRTGRRFWSRPRH
jgi:hypothetical protein